MVHKLLTVRIDAETLQQLRLATVARDTTIAEIVRGCLKEWLAKNPSPKISGGGRARAATSKAAGGPKGRKAGTPPKTGVRRKK